MNLSRAVHAMTTVTHLTLISPDNNLAVGSFNLDISAVHKHRHNHSQLSCIKVPICSLIPEARALWRNPWSFPLLILLMRIEMSVGDPYKVFQYSLIKSFLMWQSGNGLFNTYLATTRQVHCPVALTSLSNVTLGFN